MRDLIAIANECMAEQDMLGIEYGKVTEWKVNTRALKRWGQCRKLSYGTYEININYDLLREDNDIKGLKETIHHELAHTVDGCMNHGAKWNSVVNKINTVYGYNIKRTNSAEDKGVSVRRAKPKPTYKYAIACPKCGVLERKTKMCKVVQHPNWYRCAICKSEKLTVINL